LTPAEIEESYASDPQSAAAEYGAKWREDVSEFISLDLLNQLIVPGREKLPRLEGVQYTGFVDVSGASVDAMVLAISHEHSYGRVQQSRFVLDCLLGFEPPMNVEEVIGSFCRVLREYKCSSVTGDRYGGAFVAQSFNRMNVSYNPSDKSKSEIYADAMPLFSSGRVELLDSGRLKAELMGLERRTTRGSGKIIIDHPQLRTSRDDHANAACGSLTACGIQAGDPWGGIY